MPERKKVTDEVATKFGIKLAPSPDKKEEDNKNVWQEYSY